jgi:transposase
MSTERAEAEAVCRSNVPPAEPTLFEVTAEMVGPSGRTGVRGPDAEPQAGAPRLRQANRRQIRMLSTSLDELVPDDHVVRTVWAYVERLDVSPLLANIRAVEHARGRDATDPRLLIALWLLATLEGVGSARALDRLCRLHIAYRWILGDVTMNYHTLSNFRVEHEEYLDEQLTTGVAVLMQQGLVTLKRVAEDGMRVRAAAGASSFHRQATLEAHLAEAREQIERLKKELEEDSAAGERRRNAARQRAARERAERLEQALQAREEVERQRRDRGCGSEKKEARGSSTDPEARRMKMPDGGFRPAYNTQLATDVESGMIVGVIVTNQGTDNTGLKPMVEQIEERFAKRPEEQLVDGGFVNLEQIEAVEQAGTKVYAPLKDKEKILAKGQDPFARRKGDSDEVAQWRQRMGTEEAKEIYKERASTAEWTNANYRNRGFYRVTVRGTKKTRCVALWQALAQNLLQAVKLLQRATQKVAKEVAAALGSAFPTETVRAQPAGP